MEDSFANCEIKHKFEIVELSLPTEDINLPDDMDWIEFIAYPDDNKPIPINTLKGYSISIEWTKIKFVAKGCKCILYEKVRDSFSKKLIKEIRKYGFIPENLISPMLRYKLRFKLDKKHIGFFGESKTKKRVR